MASKLAIAVAIKAKDLLSPAVVKMATALKSRLNPALAATAARAASAAKGVKTIGDVATPISKAFRRLGLAGIAAGAGMAALLKQSIDYGDAIGETAQRLGVTVELLAELRYAAERSGVSAEDLDSAIGSLVKQMGLMQAGSGRMGKFLDRVGPAFKRQLLASKSSEEALTLYLDALSRIKDPARRAAMAAAAFGGAGAKMGLLAQRGAKGIADLRAEAVRYGRATTEQADAAGAADDALIRLTASARGLRDAVAARLLPAITPMIEKLADWIAKNKELLAQKITKKVLDFADAVARIDFEKVAKSIGNMADSAGKLSDSIGGIGATLKYLGALWAGSELLRGVAAVVAHWGKLSKAIGVAYSALSWIARLGWANPLIAASAYMVYKWIRNFDEIKQGAEYLGSDLMDIYRGIGSAIAGFIGRAADQGAAKLAWLRDTASGMAESMGEALRSAWRIATDYISSAMERVGNRILAIFRRISDAVSGLVSRVGIRLPSLQMSGPQASQASTSSAAPRIALRQAPPPPSPIARADIGGRLDVVVHTDGGATAEVRRSEVRGPLKVTAYTGQRTFAMGGV